VGTNPSTTNRNSLCDLICEEARFENSDFDKSSCLCRTAPYVRSVKQLSVWIWIVGGGLLAGGAIHRPGSNQHYGFCGQPRLRRQHRTKGSGSFPPSIPAAPGCPPRGLPPLRLPALCHADCPRMRCNKHCQGCTAGVATASRTTRRSKFRIKVFVRTNTGSGKVTASRPTKDAGPPQVKRLQHRRFYRSLGVVPKSYEPDTPNPWPGTSIENEREAASVGGLTSAHSQRNPAGVCTGGAKMAPFARGAWTTESRVWGLCAPLSSNR